MYQSSTFNINIYFQGLIYYFSSQRVVLSSFGEILLIIFSLLIVIFFTKSIFISQLIFKRFNNNYLFFNFYYVSLNNKLSIYNIFYILRIIISYIIPFCLLKIFFNIIKSIYLLYKDLNVYLDHNICFKRYLFPLYHINPLWPFPFSGLDHW
jgi:hypothetical protein